MFGYVVANIEDATDEEKARYHAAYCGLCRTLGRRCGQRCRLALNYDMTFLVLLLESLYEPPTITSRARCMAHPLTQHDYTCGETTDYAADVTVALAYHKCLDDWNDDRSVAARVGAAALSSAYRRVRTRLPRQCGAIERELALFKVAAAPERRNEIIEIANIFRAKIVDVGKSSLTIEATGDEDKLKGLEDLFCAYGIHEIVRTGKIAMSRNSKE